MQIRDYAGDFEDVAELTRRVWTSSYRGRTWFPLWDAGFLRWQAAGNEHALVPAAYDGARLVGCFFSIPQSLRAGASVLPIGLASWCTVDPDYRSMQPALRVIDALRARHEELGLAFSLGVVSGDKASLANRFWTQYARAYPWNFRFLFRFGFWIKLLDPDRIARASVKVWERLAIRALRPVLREAEGRSDADIRWYRAEDLPQCGRLLEAATGRFDWTLLWPAARLTNQLQSGVSGTVVLEQDARVRGMVNYHTLFYHGRELVRAAAIDLWADDNIPIADRVRLLRRVCLYLRERDVHMVIALRSAMMPARAFAANRFIPQPAHDHFVALFPREELALTLPRTWSLVLR